ncbi:MAG TPA: hypothetical protein VFE30_17370 [Anaeromyxobacteraceae bacterium]|jgi:hypothetical protein|nr:hypothetical protein [Anaeromyxobacteraceae bacterium]
MILLALSLLSALNGVALAATPIAAHARVRFPKVRPAPAARPRLVLLPDERSPFASCALRPCGSHTLEPLRSRLLGDAHSRPEDLVLALARQFTRDPTFFAAADRLRFDVRGNGFVVAWRLPGL